MTESEWLSATNPGVLLGYLQTRPSASERKARLFVCACCRRIWHLLRDPRSRNAIEVVERYFDGAASDRELKEAIRGASEASNSVDMERDGPALYNAASAVYRTADDIVDPLTDAEEAAGEAGAAAADSEFDADENDEAWSRRRDEEDAAQANLVRDIFGPFRRVSFKPTWRTADVRALAIGIYQDRAFERLPILADALEEAGCTSAAILDHLRGGGPHVPGCWVLDRILQKKSRRHGAFRVHFDE
jgi:hypothetical protein